TLSYHTTRTSTSLDPVFSATSSAHGSPLIASGPGVHTVHILLGSHPRDLHHDTRCHRDHSASTSSHPPPAPRPTPVSPRHPPHPPPLPIDTAWTPSSAQSPPSRSSGACGAPAPRRPLPQTTPARLA